MKFLFTESSCSAFDISKIAEAISLASIRRKERQVEKELTSLGFGDDCKTFRDRRVFISAKVFRSLELSWDASHFQKTWFPDLPEIPTEFELKKLTAPLYRVKSLNEKQFRLHDRSNEMRSISCFRVYFTAYARFNLVKERLGKDLEQLRALRKLKIESISLMLRILWNNRNKVNRSCTSAVSDPMLKTIPTPPTSMVAFGSLERGGAVIAIGG